MDSRVKDRSLLLIEIVVIGAVFVLDWRDLLPFSKTPYLLVLGWLSLRCRGLRWKDVGLRAPGNWKMSILAGLLVGIAMETLELFATQPLLTKWFAQGPDLHQLNRLIGNSRILVIALVLAWALAAFGEETVYRGYLMNRAAGLFHGSKRAWLVSLVLITILFGLAHFPQGITGVTENVIDGAILAILYLASGRNLCAPIVAHGIQDSIDVVLIYLGRYPGM